MNALLPGCLHLFAALLVGAAVAAAALAVHRLCLYVQARFLAGGRTFAGEASAEGTRFGFGRVFRRTVIAFLATGNVHWVPARRLRQLDRALQRSGNPSDVAAAELVAWMELLALAFFAGGVALDAMFELGFALCFFAAAAGLCWPLIWLRDKIRHRHHLITRALPYNLDLLTLSVEAGLDFAAAVGKVAEKGRPGPLRDELARMLKELKLGKTREEALRDLAGRAELIPLTTFANALIQADRMGTPLGRILRILATQMRIDRTHRAEKLANEAPVKLLLPLIGFIFPTIFIILFAPIAYSMFFGGTF